VSKRAPSALPPIVFGSERFLGMSHDEVVECMGVPHLSRAALWWLVWAGPAATPAVRAGLHSDNAAVRGGCCELLEHWPGAEAFPELEVLLSDADPVVRRKAAHTLTCDHCREGTWATRRIRRAAQLEK
jgi:hypothetical protein